MAGNSISSLLTATDDRAELSAPPDEVPAFDLQKYLKQSGATRPETFDWSDPGPRLDEEALFCLGYMMDVEVHTIIYLRELLSTRVVEDPSITAFLSCWNYEEFLHGEVLKKFLSTQGIQVNDARFRALRQVPAADRFVQVGARLLSHMTRHFPAVHMTWGALNELVAVHSYRALAERARHPLLTTILTRIVKDERRHFSFYFNQARVRLRPRAAQRLTVAIIKAFWTPVGQPIHGEAATRRMEAYLYADPEAGWRRRQEIDATISRLPGFAWFDMARRY